MYSREERTRLPGEINHMPASIPGAERYFRRSLHITCEELQGPFIILSGSQEQRGCPLIRAHSVIRSNTVIIKYHHYMVLKRSFSVSFLDYFE